ncbi:MAG: MFS transporter, partial [Nocardiopsaceae bacterium]|nr:MFS transporter [Nocardiopsaceae bacterium]
GGALAGSVGALFGAGLVLAVSAGCGVLGCAVLLSTPAVRRLPSRPAERASPRPTRMPSGS